ncbi:MAG: hypothetical protein KY445_12950 [Armatimonadetes bacterium]|nr:hypothetical protein [Armatimonadota bacterium]
MRDYPVSHSRLASLILLGFLALITLPYALAPLILPQNAVWGGLLGSADDQNVHLMWARQAQEGAFFLRDKFTTESLVSGEKPLFFNVLPALMGILARIFGVDVVFPYHVLRVALAAWALWQFHQLARLVTRRDETDNRLPIFALLLLCFTTGAGFLASLPFFGRFLFIDRPDGNFPLMPEAFFLLSAFAYPLNIASFGLLALLFRKLIEKSGALTAFFAALLLANIHTYDALPFLATATLWALWQAKNAEKSAMRVTLAAICGAILPVAYQFFVFRGSEEFRLKALTVTAPPDLPSMLLVFAPLLVLAAFGIRKWREFPAIPLLLLWIATTFALVYAPTTLFSFARKMIEGVQIPLVLLAAIGAGALWDKMAAFGPRQLVFALGLGILMISPAQFFGWIWNNTLENNAARWRVLMPPLALSRGDAAALRAIEKQGGDGAVLSLPYLGSYVPRATGKWTYAGHWAETLRFETEKFPRVARFYQGRMTPDEARAFLCDHRIRWVVEGQFEREFSGGVSVASQLGLRPIFRGGDAETGMTTVFEVY